MIVHENFMSRAIDSKLMIQNQNLEEYKLVPLEITIKIIHMYVYIKKKSVVENLTYSSNYGVQTPNLV